MFHQKRLPDMSAGSRVFTVMDKATTYENVYFRHSCGKLLLTADKMIFRDENVQYWRWDTIEKHQVSSKKNFLLKLVSAENNNKSIIFQLPTFVELERVRKDVSQRLRENRKRMDVFKRTLPMETLRCGSFAENCNGIDVSFHSIVTDTNHMNGSMSILGLDLSDDSIQSRRSPSILKRVWSNGRRRVSFSDMDEADRRALPRLPSLLLDPGSRPDTKKVTPVFEVNVLAKTLASSNDWDKPKQKEFENKGKSFPHFVSILLVGIILVATPILLSKTGHFMSVDEKPLSIPSSRKTYTFPQKPKKRFFLHTSQEKKMERQVASLRRCFWDVENGNEKCMLGM